MKEPEKPPEAICEELNGAEIVVESLIRFGVPVVFGLPGGASLPLYDVLFRRQDRLRHILVRHEQGAAFMAQGFARVTGRAGVCMASSGPGATNLVTGIADAFRDSIPLVAITAQVSRHLIGTDAFQEIDTRGMCLPISKHVFVAQSARELLAIMPAAFDLAEGGRPGPVVIDIPKDVQQEICDVAHWPGRRLARPGLPEMAAGDRPERRRAHPDRGDAIYSAALPSNADLREGAGRLLEMLASARRPVILAGGGVIQAGASGALREFARRHSLPVATTLMGIGLIEADDPLCLGMPGMHAAPWTNRVLEETDLLICIGARFDDRATGVPEEFCARARIAHIDIDPTEIGKIKATDLGIVADAGVALRAALDAGRDRYPGASPDASAWLRRIHELRAKHPLPLPGAPGDLRRPLQFLHSLAGILPEDAIVTTDVGQHQMWVAQVFPFRRPRSLITSGGLGTMGFGLPAAIGAGIAAALANERRCPKVVCVSGDGSILMNLQELATLADLQLNVAVVIMDNGHLGLVRQQQELFYRENIHGSRFDSQTDFAALARAFGIAGVDLEAAADQDEALVWLERALAGGRPVVIRAPVAANDLVLPMVPAGAANRDMIEARPKRKARRP